MTESLRALLDQSVDYAGLFPPAELPMDGAVAEYAAVSSGPGAWLVDRMVCPVARLSELADSAVRAGLPVVRVAAVGRPASTAADVSADAALVRSAPAPVVVEAYEGKLAEAAAAAALAKPFATLAASLESAVWPLFVEVPRGPGRDEAMHALASEVPDVGFKLRTGGTVPEAFPSVEEVASFIVESASLEAPIKFTAGLHEPLRYWDEGDGAWHHGFVAVLAAACLAYTQDLSRREVGDVLEAGSFEFTDEGFHVGPHHAGIDQVAEFREWFGGFGSCSVEEPLAGLARLGWLVGATA